MHDCPFSFKFIKSWIILLRVNNSMFIVILVVILRTLTKSVGSTTSSEELNGLEMSSVFSEIVSIMKSSTLFLAVKFLLLHTKLK